MPVAIAPQTITTPRGSFTVPGAAYLDGRDPDAQPPLTVMSINVWDAVPRQRIVCQLPHGAQVTLCEALFYESEGRYYFLVEAGDCRGWLPEPFLSETYHEPIGDLF